MQMVKYLGRAALLVMLIAVVSYGFIYYKIKVSIDQELKLWRPFLDIQYAFLSLNPLGGVGLSSVTIDVMGYPSGITLDRIYLESNPLFLLYFDSRVNSGRWPDSLSLNVEGLLVDYNSPYLLMLEQLHKPSDDWLTALSCDHINQFNLTALREMGLGQERFDLRFNLNSGKKNPLNLQLLMLMHGWVEIVADVDIDKVVGLQNLVKIPSEATRITLSLRDMGFNQLKNGYCAMSAGLTIPEYEALNNKWLGKRSTGLSDELIFIINELREPNASISFQRLVKTIGQQEQIQLSVVVNNQIQALDAEQLLMLIHLLKPVELLLIPETARD